MVRPGVSGWVAEAAYRPELLDVAQLNIVLGNLLQDGEVRVRRAQASDGRITRWDEDMSQRSVQARLPGARWWRVTYRTAVAMVGG